MTLTNRDKRILIVLPALVLLFGYALWFTLTDKRKLLTQLRASAEMAEKNVPSRDKLLESQRRLMKVSGETAQATERATKARSELTRLMGCLDKKDRADRLHRLTSLLTQHRATILDHAELAQGSPIPPSVEALRKLLPDARGEAVRLHKIRFMARYEDVCGAAHALARDGSLAIPVSLTMKESVNYSAWHEWVFLVWI